MRLFLFKWAGKEAGTWICGRAKYKNQQNLKGMSSTRQEHYTEAPSWIRADPFSKRTVCAQIKIAGLSTVEPP